MNATAIRQRLAALSAMAACLNPKALIMTTLYKAELHTTNFHFESIGDSIENARHGLIEGLTRHSRQYKIKPDWWREYVDEIRVTEFALNGVALRDREPIR